MKFVEFANFLKRLEEVSKRLVMIGIVAELIESMSKEEVAMGIYLSLGELVPGYRGVEFGMAEKMVVRALAMSSGRNEEVIKRSYKKQGDLGKVALEFLKPSNRADLSVEDVYKALLALTADGGGGSQERKVVGLSQLLTKVSALEAKYIVRVVVGKLRLGFSDKTVLEALSRLEKNDRSLKKRLEVMYQIYPDVGRLVALVKMHGWQKAAKELKLEVGVPVMSALCQRLNTAEEIIAKMGKVGVERKYDGTRVQIHFDRNGVRTFSRNLEVTSDMFPELRFMGRWVKAKEIILDSEAIGIDKQTGRMLPFQETITRKRKHGVSETANRIPLQFNVFDVLYLNGKTLIDESYKRRRMILNEVIRNNETLVVDEYFEVDNAKDLHQYHERFLREGFEGAVVKKINGGYLPGRQGWNWVKIKETEGALGKLADTLDLVVMGFYRGRGKRSGFGMGAFLVGVVKGNDLLTIAKIGTGLTDDQFRELKKRLDSLVVVEKPVSYVVDKNMEPDVWVEPELVVEIAADEITKSPIHTAGVALRFPRLVKFREDKSVDQATAWKELAGMKR